ncbi:MAG TPA: PTS sugar transporter subunit IIA [Thermodesulfobacteriota bacterium]|nr:PTS sugar transporter subunit IIA [Thermodesulfobacteriota bacterium]
MIGIVIVTHCNLGQELIRAADFIVGSLSQIKAISINPEDQVESLREKIAAAIEKVDTGEGVIILTDMFGGTPANVSLSFLVEGKVEVVTGVNLPMLVGLTSKREGKTLNQAAIEIKDYGLRSIALAGEILKKGAR